MKRRISYKRIVKGGGVVILLFLVQCRPESNFEFSPLGEVVHPQDNPSSEDKIELGKKLFFDSRLSSNQTISCASCHIPKFAFTDRLPVSIGVGGGKTVRNSPSILNAGHLKTLMFDAHIKSLEEQVIVPIQEHVEMNISVGELVDRLKNIPEYQDAAKKIFNREFDAWVLTRSLACFERSLISDDSKFDQYMYKQDHSVMSSSELNGWKIFSEKLYCTDCHPAPHFTNFLAENNGVYEDYGQDKGRFRIKGDTLDIGRFKVPSLRNVALTFPYMHDGSMKTLREVIEHYEVGGKSHFNKSNSIKPFTLTDSEKVDLENFLRSLSDTSYLDRLY